MTATATLSPARKASVTRRERAEARRVTKYAHDLVRQTADVPYAAKRPELIVGDANLIRFALEAAATRHGALAFDAQEAGDTRIANEHDTMARLFAGVLRRLGNKT